MPSHPPSAATWIGGAIMGAAVLLQFSVLGASSGGSVSLGVGAALLTIGIWSRRERWPHAAALVSTTALGGAAMLLGGLLGGTTSGHAYAHGAMAHAAADTGAAATLWSPATVAMLVACAVGLHGSGCARSGGGRWRTGMLHALCAAAMLGGMVVGGRSLGPVLSVELGAAAGTHVAMLAGMAAGNALALAAGSVVNQRVGARLRLGDGVRSAAKVG